MTIGCILMAIGIALTVIHFSTEDILGLEKIEKEFLEAQRLLKSKEAPVVLKSKSINMSEIKDDPEELTKYTALRVEESLLVDYAVDITPDTVNPLDLPFFMASTIVVSFGIVFIIIATTWWRIVVDKENQKSKG